MLEKYKFLTFSKQIYFWSEIPPFFSFHFFYLLIFYIIGLMLFDLGFALKYQTLY